MFSRLMAAVPAFFTVVTLLITGAQTASAQWCCPTQGSYSSNYGSYSTLNVVHGTYYRPLDPNFRAPKCGWAFYTGPAEVLTGNYLGGCMIQSRSTGQKVHISQWLHFFQEPMRVRTYCPPAIVKNNPCPSIKVVPRGDCPDPVLAEELKNAPAATKDEKELLADL